MTCFIKNHHFSEKGVVELEKFDYEYVYDRIKYIKIAKEKYNPRNGCDGNILK